MFECVREFTSVDGDAFDAAVTCGLSGEAWELADNSVAEVSPGQVEPFGLEPVSPGEVWAYPDSAARWTARALPSPLTGAVLAEIPRQRLSAAGRVDVLVGVNRQIAGLRAAEYRVLAVMKDQADRLDREQASMADGGSMWVDEDIRAALRVGRDEARSKLVEGQILVHELPRTLGLLTQGVITGRQAERLAEASIGLTPEQTGRLEERVLTRARYWPGPRTSPSPSSVGR